MAQRPMLSITSTLLKGCLNISSKLTRTSIQKRWTSVSSVLEAKNRCKSAHCRVACNTCNKGNLKTFATATRAQPDVHPELYFHQVVCEHDNGMVKVQWKNGGVNQFPYLWLRDNCQCDACYLPPSHARISLLVNINEDTVPNNIKILDGSQKIQITWCDGHVSELTSDWLWDHRFEDEGLESRRAWLPLKSKTWGNKEMQDKIPTDTFPNLLNDDEALYNWICTMEQEGIFMVTDTPCQSGMLELFANRIAFLRKNNYGVPFTVKAKIDPSNAAYSAHALGFHTDLPYYKYCPGIQMLHCIKQVPTIGGGNILSDGFYVAEKLKEERPDYFELLTTIPVDYQDIGVDAYKFHKLHREPIISLNREGEFERITWNNMQRDAHLTVPLDNVIPLYKAMKHYNDMMYREENHIQTKLEPGQIIIFHNYRVLHGREAFEVLEGGERHLEGGYIDWDELYSKRRVLQAELGVVPKIKI